MNGPAIPFEPPPPHSSAPMDTKPVQSAYHESSNPSHASVPPYSRPSVPLSSLQNPVTDTAPLGNNANYPGLSERPPPTRQSRSRPNSPAAHSWANGHDSVSSQGDDAVESVASQADGEHHGMAAASRRTVGNGERTGRLSLTFRIPTASSGSRASTPGTGKRKRRSETAPNSEKTSRSRLNTPPASSHLDGSYPSGPSSPPRGALSIFAPPPSSSLPQALQDAIGSSSSSRQAGTPTNGISPAPLPDNLSDMRMDVDADPLVREAGEGFESRLRSARSKDSPVVKTGVSASGKGVKVGGAAKEPSGSFVKKKGKGKAEIPNQDFCSVCRGPGKFLCCDGCPRSFHFMCLEPPLRVDELPEEETWFCKQCISDRSRTTLATPVKDKEAKPIPFIFKALCKRADEENPVQFKLPSEIQQFFAGVGTDSRGNYMDAVEPRMRYDRKGYQEERDATKLRDGRRPVACYACGGTSIPLRSATTDPESSWRQIVSCDYCALHWHLDCLSPPLTSMPNSGRKWMCPNHVEQVMIRRRTLRNNLETVDVEDQGQPNNGNIVILPEEEGKEILEYEDMIINRKKYRVPERIIRLDFWNKVGLGNGKVSRKARHNPYDSDSSDLTSLSSPELVPATPSNEDMEAANLILGLQSSKTVPTPASALNTQNTPIALTSTTNDDTKPLTLPALQTQPLSPKQPRIVLRFNGNGHANGAAKDVSA